MPPLLSIPPSDSGREFLIESGRLAALQFLKNRNLGDDAIVETITQLELRVKQLRGQVIVEKERKRHKRHLVFAVATITLGTLLWGISVGVVAAFALFALQWTSQEILRWLFN